MKVIAVLVFLGVALAGSQSSARADSYTFESALNSFPDPYRFMSIAAINNQGAVVGGYSYNYFAIGVPTNFTQAALPGTPYQVVVSGLNNSDTVVGGFQAVSLNATPGPYQGFLYRNGVTTPVNVPNAQSTFLSGINDAGDIVGYTNGASGFLLKAGTAVYQSVNYPGAQETYPTGINKFGEIVGWYVDNSGNHAFTEKNGVYTTLVVPASLGVVNLGTVDEEATGINDNGDIVGFFPGATEGQGFIYSNGTYSLFDYPGVGTATLLKGINDAGQVVGLYADSATGEALDGFVATPVTLSAAPEPQGIAFAVGITLLMLWRFGLHRNTRLR